MQSIEITNFKKIKNLKLEGLKRVNLIGGCNNSGKSTILEAIYLLQNVKSDQIWNLLLSNMLARQLPAGNLLEAVKNLFYKFNFSQSIKIDGDTCSITFSSVLSKPEELVVESVTEITNDKNVQIEKQNNSRKIKIEVVYPDGTGLNAEILNNKIIPLNNIDFSTIKYAPCIFIDENNCIRYLQNYNAMTQELSRLIENNLEHELVTNALQLFDKKINSIAILDGRVDRRGGIYIGHNDFFVKIPLLSYGGGVRKVLNIVMSIMNGKDGIVLIDEIENGIHYSIMPKVWEMICKLTKRYNCQLLATTHSQEYAEYILNNQDVWNAHKEEFNFITLNTYDDEVIIPSTRVGDEFAYAVIDNHSELRG